MSPPAPLTPGARTWVHRLRPDLLAAVGAIVITLPASFAVLGQQSGLIGRGETVVLAVLIVVLTGAPLLAVRHPLVGFGIATAAMAALTLLPPAVAVSAALFPSGIGYLLCLGQVASRLSTRWAVTAWASGVVGAGLIALTVRVEHAAPPGGVGLRAGVFVGLVAGVTASAAVGLLLRARRAQSDERVRARVHQAIAEERIRLSHDLHDVIAHSLTVIIAQTDVAAAVLRDDPDAAERALTTAAGTGRDALRGMRGVLSAEPEATRAPVPTIDDLPLLVAGVRSPVCDVSFEEQGMRGALDASAVRALHRAVQEGLTNAVRHTRHPVRIEVRLDWSDAGVLARVSDDGGAGALAGGFGTGTGLIGLIRRVEAEGGTVIVGPRDPRGWDLIVRLPVGKKQR
ncbi:histidine kinase [Microbacterium sp. NPDC089318]